MRTLRFSTADLPLRDQLAAWRAWFEPVYGDVIPTEPEAGGFAGECVMLSLGEVAMGRVDAPGLRAVRRPSDIRRDPVDHWVLAVGRGTPTQIVTPDGVQTIPARAPFIVSLGDPIESTRQSDGRLHLYLARDRFAAIAPLLDRARNRPIRGAAGQMLTDYLLLIEKWLPALSEAEVPRLFDAMAAMIGGCLALESRPEPDVASQVRLTRIERARQVIRRHLGSAGLGPAVLCRALSLSRSELYRLFEGEGGVMRYIQRQRLLACHAALSDPAEHRTIAAIGEAHGFTDTSVFGRSFRQMFGATPGEVRAAASVGAATPAAAAPLLDAERLTLQDCLRAA